jgi:hypothetical protein
MLFNFKNITLHKVYGNFTPFEKKVYLNFYFYGTHVCFYASSKLSETELECEITYKENFF